MGQACMPRFWVACFADPNTAMARNDPSQVSFDALSKHVCEYYDDGTHDHFPTKKCLCKGWSKGSSLESGPKVKQ